MAGFIKGDIVIVPFPFSDLTQTKRRPALVIATLQGNDLILCQITIAIASRDSTVYTDILPSDPPGFVASEKCYYLSDFLHISQFAKRSHLG